MAPPFPITLNNIPCHMTHYVLEDIVPEPVFLAEVQVCEYEFLAKIVGSASATDVLF